MLLLSDTLHINIPVYRDLYLCVGMTVLIDDFTGQRLYVNSLSLYAWRYLRPRIQFVITAKGGCQRVFPFDSSVFLQNYITNWLNPASQPQPAQQV